MRTGWIAALAAAALWAPVGTAAQTGGFLRAEGTRIVDETGRPVVLRGMGLGGWVLQEGYMLQLGALGQQHVIRARIADLIGEEKTEAFYAAWRANHTTKADIDAMGRWGFNSVRLPMHYDRLTLPVDQEPVAGRDTWKEEGFAEIDALLAWVKANGMYLILDLHAAPGGQGSDLAISDRDPAKPSLWDSAENRRKTVALWRRLAERYADEPAIGAYDLINEPNWDFEGPGGGHGCQETTNAPLRALMVGVAALSLLALALAGLGIFAVIRTQIQLRQYELAVRQSLGARPKHLLQLTLLDSLKPLLWAVLLLAVAYSALQLSVRFGWSFGFAAQLQIAPLNATVALLTVLLLTTLIVLACVRPLLSRPVVQTLRQ